MLHRFQLSDDTVHFVSEDVRFSLYYVQMSGDPVALFTHLLQLLALIFDLFLDLLQLLLSHRQLLRAAEYQLFKFRGESVAFLGFDDPQHFIAEPHAADVALFGCHGSSPVD